MASVIIVFTSVYFLIRFFFSRNAVVSQYPNQNEHMRHHVISVPNNNEQLLDWLPVFTFSSIPGNKSGGDCAVCLSKFEAKDHLRRLPCFHAFHVECIDSWIKCNQTCPLCRSTINLSEADTLNKTAANSNRSNSLRVEIGTISQRRDPSESGRSYSVGSFEYVVYESYEIPVESTHRRSVSVDKDELVIEELAAEIGGGNRNWLCNYVDRVSFCGSGRWFTGSNRRSVIVEDYEATHGRTGEERSEYFRWLSGV